MQLKIDVQLIPPAQQIDSKTMDDLLNGELVEFEKWFIRRQRERGLDASGLIGAERGLVKAYLIYAATERSS